MARDRIRRAASRFPAVLIVGPRQCGKTTLARRFLKGEYFDLEKPSDYRVFADDPELALQRFKGPLILDEAQTLPALFPVLRAIIDERGGGQGRYFLLGSVNPLLVRHISETLAGRVAIVELTPFLFAEARLLKTPLSRFWLRGGFPAACRARSASAWASWQENYVRTFVERDIGRLGVRVSPVQMRRFITMLAHYHGAILNASELGGALGVSYHTVQDYLDMLEQHFLVRRLPAYHASLKKRLVKAPRVYLRDTGLLHHLLGIENDRMLLTSPKRGASWEGMLVEQIAALERLARPRSQVCYYRTHAGAEVDLVVDRGRERIGYEFKCAAAVGAHDAANLKAAMAEGIVQRGYLVYAGTRRFPVGQSVEVIGAEELLTRGPQEHKHEG